MGVGVPWGLPGHGVGLPWSAVAVTARGLPWYHQWHVTAPPTAGILCHARGCRGDAMGCTFFALFHDMPWNAVAPPAAKPSTFSPAYHRTLHGSPRYTMEPSGYHGVPWWLPRVAMIPPVARHGTPRRTMISCATPWRCHGMPWVVPRPCHAKFK